ncbi:hypothetical protein GLOTRDRAFT_131645 [Gloeophyllum trabeum ATCC 11539]|uniref:Uncharacterized protein n=1 Tax=Gloeophyllum trabeum (strain ATCC 11539 / FP-39264 / Madison 617) TaxID=670483 RepID=S7Q0D6_GLOTA|nr:uncharacterized protein GLOTRDRAFT_131645 [Gloeophyllum trabeum ATCC 11539]EPQ53376.1 hypothetical protein GLOTRDRAFT_131645 [Gloeophyllum trabeum ATCC 11539]
MPRVADKINGVIPMVQGIGDQISGSLMETLDSSLSSISNDPSASPTHSPRRSPNADLCKKGKEEYRQRPAKVAGVPATVGDGIQPEKEGAEVRGSERPSINPHEVGQVGHGTGASGLYRAAGGFCTRTSEHDALASLAHQVFRQRRIRHRHTGTRRAPEPAHLGVNTIALCTEKVDSGHCSPYNPRPSRCIKSLQSYPSTHPSPTNSQLTMHFLTMHLPPALFALALLPLPLALGTPGPFKRENTCLCESPSGCPGLCAGATCVNYCGNGVALACAACDGFSGNCIMDAGSDGGCFTVVE